MSEHGRFNAQDPFDATAERIRTMMCNAALSVIETPEYRALSADKQLEVVLCGMMTGVMSVAFSCVIPEGRDGITSFIKSYVDQARDQVESIDFAEGSTQ